MTIEQVNNISKINLKLIRKDLIKILNDNEIKFGNKINETIKYWALRNINECQIDPFSGYCHYLYFEICNEKHEEVLFGNNLIKIRESWRYFCYLKIKRMFKNQGFKIKLSEPINNPYCKIIINWKITWFNKFKSIIKTTLKWKT